MLIQKLKEDGVFIGYDKFVGYMYEMNNHYYAINKNGLQKLSR